LKECSTFLNSGSRPAEARPVPRPNRSRRKAKQDRARETVEVILDAAARILVERGYAAATTNRIAEAAGVSVGTVYEYFANKEEVFGALIERELDGLVEAIASRPLDTGEPLGGRIGGLLTAAMRAMRFGPGLFRALEQVPEATFRHRLADARTRVVAFVRDLLEAHRAELRVADLDRAAFVVVSAAEGVGGNASDEVFDEGLAGELAELVQAYLVGSERAGRGEPQGQDAGGPRSSGASGVGRFAAVPTRAAAAARR
jgi:AcrR family transcriptional regulator